jgi:hypothetical protein
MLAAVVALFTTLEAVVLVARAVEEQVRRLAALRVKLELQILAVAVAVVASP